MTVDTNTPVGLYSLVLKVSLNDGVHTYKDYSQTYSFEVTKTTALTPRAEYNRHFSVNENTSFYIGSTPCTQTPSNAAVSFTYALSGQPTWVTRSNFDILYNSSGIVGGSYQFFFTCTDSISGLTA